MKYLEVFRLSMIHSLKNYKSLIGLSLFLVTCLVIFAHLWKVAAAKIGAVDLHPDQLLWYIALNEWVLISLPDPQDEMEQDLRSGRLAYLLPRPISYLAATFCESFGILCVNLFVLGIVAFGFTWLKIGTIPFDLTAIPLMLMLGIAAGCVAILFHMLIGISAFWLHDVSPFYWIWEKFLFILGGLILPLAVYPEWLQKIAQFTPFPALLGARSALAIDFNIHAVLQVFTSLLFWSLLALVSLVVLYRKGLKILNIEGG